MQEVLLALPGHIGLTEPCCIGLHDVGSCTWQKTGCTAPRNRCGDKHRSILANPRRPLLRLSALPRASPSQPVAVVQAEARSRDSSGCSACYRLRMLLGPCWLQGFNPASAAASAETVSCSTLRHSTKNSFTASPSCAQDAGLGGREAEVGSHKFPDTAGFSSLQMLLDVHVAFFHKSAAAWNSFST